LDQRECGSFGSIKPIAKLMKSSNVNSVVSEVHGDISAPTIPESKSLSVGLRTLKMKNLFAAVVVGLVWAGVSVAQGQSNGAAGQPEKVTVAVIEFTPGTNAAGMTFEDKRQLQASIAFALYKSHRFDVVDVGWTRDASKSDLTAVNDDGSTAAAVKVGKQLGVSYVLTGTVTEYTAKSDDGFGYATFRTRLVEVATGNVKYSGETAQKGTSAMRTAGAAEMQTKVLKPAIEKLTATLVAKL
jgi:TolB-like protein